MELSRRQIEQLPVHFILCTERTGSSLLSLMFNLSPNVLCPSEEPFAIFFYNRYRSKTVWTSHEIKTYVDEFWWMAEKNLDLFYSTKKHLTDALELYKDNLPYSLLVRITYLQFVEIKPKNELTCIIDKQIKYFFYLPLLLQIFPDAKFCILVRDVRDNVVSKSNHKLNSSSNAVYLSALWNYTYTNTRYLAEQKRAFTVLKYEDLASEPEKSMRRLCAFFNVPYYAQMIDTEGKYEQYLEIRKSKVDPNFINYLGSFQRSLYSGITDKKIGVYKTVLSKETEAKIITINRSLFDLFGYEYDKNMKAGLSITDKWQQFMAYMYRPFLLKFYYAIPFFVKLSIKKIRK